MTLISALWIVDLNNGLEQQMPYTEAMEKRIYEDKDGLRLAHQCLAQQVKPELFLTLATNPSMSLERKKRKAREFLARMDEYMLGRNWSKKPMI